MNCKEIENKIWEYVEGSLSREETEQIAKHINSCDYCISLEKGIRSGLLIIEKSKKAEADPFFYTRLEAKMHHNIHTTIPKRRPILQYAVAASIAFIGIIGGSFLGSYSAERLSNDFAKQNIIEQNDEFGVDLADNSFDLIKDFE